MTEPLVSVITPVYNSERFLGETIQSIMNQTYPNWELILVDDGSTDESMKIAKSFADKDSRISVVQLQTNNGAAGARNEGINQARGKYAAFLDSDDLWLPEKLERQVHFMEANQFVFTFTSYRIIREDGQKREKLVEAPEVVTYNSLLKNTIIGCLTVMLNIDVLGKVQMPTIRTRQDFVLWLTILKDGNQAYGINEELACYRKVSNSISSNKLKAAKRNWTIYRYNENLPFWKACYVFASYAWHGFKKL
ncbi:glycosyltransferase family 2 protein [Alkalicoccobacillus murimartini]|uniref:Teichuronic acid biosynthesis glycosyltransferase TuaG n=1 Tax=Alkalicoccobacillus murimartini TaxID=171685 RepID=A0ABT9YG24_9BACI|nr:glycosyltransferase family 2 protein [Alkalicoccobacillus murimartini]MDQ0206792.1 teichuronic acid biosynthesis glycosyltransferase TuaG [Alkalicoccobacillus murimartini]